MEFYNYKKSIRTKTNAVADVTFSTLPCQEYADSLRDSGVHGALMVLENTFGPNELAHALNIHQSKNIIRRHLTTEFKALVSPARLVEFERIS